MRILSKFQDYYDSMAMYGVDTTLVYDRKTMQQELPDSFFTGSHNKHLEYTEETRYGFYYHYGNVNFYRRFLFD